MANNLPETQKTFHGYRILRPISTADDTDLGAATLKFSRRPNSAVLVPEATGLVEIGFFGTDAADEILNWTLYAYKQDDYAGESEWEGPATYIANGTATLGTGQTGETNEFFADTIAITSQGWPKTVQVSDSTNNRFARLSFDLLDYRMALAILTKDTAASMGAVITWTY